MRKRHFVEVVMPQQGEAKGIKSQQGEAKGIESQQGEAKGIESQQDEVSPSLKDDQIALLTQENADLRVALRNSKIANEDLVSAHSEDLASEHSEVVALLKGRRPTENLLEELREVKKVKVGLIVHDLPKLVADFILHQEDKKGLFRRQKIHQYKQDHSLIFWQHCYADSNKVVEYLLDVKFEGNAVKGLTIKLISVDEMDLPSMIRKSVYKATATSRISNAKRAIIRGEIQIIGHEFGQSAVTFHGELEAAKQSGLAKLAQEEGEPMGAETLEAFEAAAAVAATPVKDLRVSLPRALIDKITHTELKMANRLQEKHR
ncbi:hypothetical protein TrRE_jg924 [Triparma retinervis]|uniref:Uncharacterized protein n=1 Tax=Triparma retinervis TaxID=2557542 RepID=A0A9W7ACH9_9STRA|nr:hypothetical protein TrRE_jg924 [Triparma retinervis]